MVPEMQEEREPLETVVGFPMVVIVYSLSCAQLFATSWIIAHQAPLSMGFPRQEYWSE